MKRRTLPRKPSKLITIALDDLIAVEKSEKYKVDMGEYHLPENGTCSVCFAGAVIAQSLGASSLEELVPSQFSGKIANKLYALNELRQGNVEDAVAELGYAEKKQQVAAKYDRRVPEYYNDPKQFKKDMRKLARDLAKAGL